MKMKVLVWTIVVLAIVAKQFSSTSAVSADIGKRILYIANSIACRENGELTKCLRFALTNY